MQISYVDYKKNNVQNYGERIFLLLISIYIRFSNMKVFLMHKGIKRKKNAKTNRSTHIHYWHKSDSRHE